MMKPTLEMDAADMSRRLTETIETRVREEAMGEGILRIHESWIDGKLFASVFTMDSLAHVLGMPMSTMEGRYKRAQLARWMVPVRNYAGRPTRGFPYALFDQVVAAIQHPRAVIVEDRTGTSVKVNPRARQIQELEPDYYLNERYYTVRSLARSFGYSETTVRRKLDVAGLLKKFHNLGSPMQGGRPKRGIHERFLGEVKLAVTDNVQFFTRYDRTVLSASGAMGQARSDMHAAVAPHTPPAPGSMQAWDPDTRAPVFKQPASAPTGAFSQQSDDAVDALAELGHYFGEQIKAGTLGMTPPAQPAPTPTVRPVEPVAMPTPAQAARAEREERQANLARAKEFQLQALVDDPAEPTPEELDDTCFMLELSGPDRVEFIETIKQGRATRWAKH